MSTSIHQQVQSLHQQLSALVNIDEATQQQLLILQADINRLLDTQVESRVSAADAVESLATRFEADHPALSSALRTLVDSLSKAGI